MLNIQCFIIFETVEVVEKNIPGETHDYLHFAKDGIGGGVASLKFVCL